MKSKQDCRRLITTTRTVTVMVTLGFMSCFMGVSVAGAGSIVLNPPAAVAEACDSDPFNDGDLPQL